jgi:hypothetical protein
MGKERSRLDQVKNLYILIGKLVRNGLFGRLRCKWRVLLKEIECDDRRP